MYSYSVSIPKGYILDNYNTRSKPEDWHWYNVCSELYILFYKRHVFKHHHNQDVELSHHHKTFLYSKFLATTKLISITIVLNFWGYYVNNITGHVTLWDWPLSLSIIFLRSIWIVLGSIFCSFVLLCEGPWYRGTII
jgi:hypothetical protein